MEYKSWINTERVYYELETANSKTFNKMLFLTELFEVYTDNKLSTPLLEHQKRTVKAMVDLERKKFISISLPYKRYNKLQRPLLETCAAVLSEKPGSGKTYEILALILENKLVPKTTEIMSLPFNKLKNKHGANDLQSFHVDVRKYYDTYFKQTIIFVGKSVLTQWKTRINSFTKLRTFVIEDIFSFKRFYSLVIDEATNKFKNLDNYDIILVKNGNITGQLKIPNLGSLNSSQSKPILSIFGELFKNACWNRIVLDDFDTLNIPHSALVIPALFTWFVSATKKECPYKANARQYENNEDFLLNYRPTYLSAYNNVELFTFFNIGCDNTFIDNSTSASIIKYYYYRFVNPNESFISFIGSMGGRNATIAEMLNGDAVVTAAQTLRIKSTNVADIFEKILNKSWISYRKNVEIEKYIPKVRELLPGLEIKNISGQVIAALKKNLKKPGPLSEARTLLKATHPAVDTMITDVERENQQNKDENGKAIQRLKDNLKENDCPVLCIPLKEAKGIVILKCCGTAISQEASVIIFNKQVPTCPKCRHTINQSQIILIDRDQDAIVNKILDDDILDNEEIIEVTEESVVDEVFDKFQCIMKIINGRENELKDIMDTERHIFISGLLEGNTDYGDAPAEKRKILIYTGYAETSIKIRQGLKKNNIKYADLMGTSSHITELVKRYNLPNDNPNAINVLIVTGPKYCAGLDLQNTTDLIFAHRVIDPNIEIQIAGRGARYGRTSNFRIHYVLYMNEITDDNQ